MTSTSETFGLHRKRGADHKAYNGLCFSIRSYLKNVKKVEVIRAVIIATYRLSLSAIVAEYPALFDALSPIHLLVLHGEKTSTKKITLNQAENEILRAGKVQSLELWEVLPQYSTGDGKKIHHAYGVHHPKYMMVFTDKGLHLMISTANFNDSDCADGTWHGFFPFLTMAASADQQSHDADNDFGDVLQDFVQKQSEQVNQADVALGPRTAPLCVVDWIEKYAQVRSIRDQFDFSSVANVRLISTVPCKQQLPPLSDKELAFLFERSGYDRSMQRVYPCDSCVREAASIQATPAIAYGQHRVGYLLRQNSFLNHAPLSKLLIQQTSIGLSINNAFMDTFLQSLMPENDWERNSPSLIGRREDAYQIIWPTLIHMNDIRRHFLLHPPPLVRLSTSLASTPSTMPKESLDLATLPSSWARTQDSELFEGDDDDSDEDDAVAEERERRHGILFFQPSFYATMEPDIHSQFHTYEPWRTSESIFAPSQFLVPHIKTYCRLLRGTSTAATPHGAKKQRRQYSATSSASHTDSASMSAPAPAASSSSAAVTDRCSCPPLGWLWLTSACLSRGAQGRIVPYSVCEDCHHVRSGYREYRNFELGVLLTSTSKRQYVALTPTCPVHRPLCSPTRGGGGGGTAVSSSHVHAERRIVPLPLPYQVTGSRPYCNERQELLVCPYFHQQREIPMYLSEFRSRDPLFCSYPASPSTKLHEHLTSLHRLLSLGHKRRFGQSTQEAEQAAADGVASLLARHHTVGDTRRDTTASGASEMQRRPPKRRRFAFQPSTGATSVTDAAAHRSRSEEMPAPPPVSDVAGYTRSVSDSVLCSPSSGRGRGDEVAVLDDAALPSMLPPSQTVHDERSQKQRQRASYPPDKFSSSQSQRRTQSQHAHIVRFFPPPPWTDDDADDAKDTDNEHNDAMDVGDSDDGKDSRGGSGRPIGHVAAPWADGDVFSPMVASRSTFDAWRSPVAQRRSSFSLQSIQTPSGDVVYRLEATDDDDAALPSPMANPSLPTHCSLLDSRKEHDETAAAEEYSLAREVNADGNVVYKLVRTPRT